MDENTHFSKCLCFPAAKKTVGCWNFSRSDPAICCARIVSYLDERTCFCITNRMRQQMRIQWERRNRNLKRKRWTEPSRGLSRAGIRWLLDVGRVCRLQHSTSDAGDRSSRTRIVRHAAFFVRVTIAASLIQRIHDGGLA